MAERRYSNTLQNEIIFNLKEAIAQAQELTGAYKILNEQMATVSHSSKNIGTFEGKVDTSGIKKVKDAQVEAINEVEDTEEKVRSKKRTLDNEDFRRIKEETREQLEFLKEREDFVKRAATRLRTENQEQNNYLKGRIKYIEANEKQEILSINNAQKVQEAVNKKTEKQYKELAKLRQKEDFGVPQMGYQSRKIEEEENRINGIFNSAAKMQRDQSERTWTGLKEARKNIEKETKIEEAENKKREASYQKYLQKRARDQEIFEQQQWKALEAEGKRVDTIEKRAEAAKNKFDKMKTSMLDMMRAQLKWFIGAHLINAALSIPQVMGESYSELERSSAYGVRVGAVMENADAGTSKHSKMIEEYQKRMIRYTTIHAASMKDYAEATYQISSAGIEWGKTIQFVNTALDLSIATSERGKYTAQDLEHTTKLLAGNYKIWGDSIKGVGNEQDKFRYIANVLTKVITDEQVELSEMINGFKYAGNTASLTNMRFVDLAVTIGFLNTLQQRGSTAGTGLRQVFNAMAKNGKSLSEVLVRDQEGIKGLADAWKIKLDDKKPISLIDTLEKVRKAMKITTHSVKFDSETLGKTFKQFNIRGANVWIPLLVHFDELKKKIEETDKVARKFGENDILNKLRNMQEVNIPFQVEKLKYGITLMGAMFLKGLLGGKDIVDVLKKINDEMFLVIYKAKDFGSFLSPVIGILLNISKTLMVMHVSYNYLPGLLASLIPPVKNANSEMQLLAITGKNVKDNSKGILNYLSGWPGELAASYAILSSVLSILKDIYVYQEMRKGNKDVVIQTYKERIKLLEELRYKVQKDGSLPSLFSTGAWLGKERFFGTSGAKDAIIEYKDFIDYWGKAMSRRFEYWSETGIDPQKAFLERITKEINKNKSFLSKIEDALKIENVGKEISVQESSEQFIKETENLSKTAEAKSRAVEEYKKWEEEGLKVGMTAREREKSDIEEKYKQIYSFITQKYANEKSITIEHHQEMENARRRHKQELLNIDKKYNQEAFKIQMQLFNAEQSLEIKREKLSRIQELNKQFSDLFKVEKPLQKLKEDYDKKKLKKGANIQQIEEEYQAKREGILKKFGFTETTLAARKGQYDYETGKLGEKIDAWSLNKALSSAKKEEENAKKNLQNFYNKHSMSEIKKNPALKEEEDKLTLEYNEAKTKTIDAETAIEGKDLSFLGKDSKEGVSFDKKETADYKRKTSEAKASALVDKKLTSGTRTVITSRGIKKKRKEDVEPGSVLTKGREQGTRIDGLSNIGSMKYLRGDSILYQQNVPDYKNFTPLPNYDTGVKDVSIPKQKEVGPQGNIIINVDGKENKVIGKGSNPPVERIATELVNELRRQGV